MPADAGEAGKWLAAAILEQPRLSKPVYQERVRPPSSDGPLMVLTDVSNSRTHNTQSFHFTLHINPILMEEILGLFFDEDDQEANAIGARCISTLNAVVSKSIEETLHHCYMGVPFSATFLSGVFPPSDAASFRREKPAMMLAIYRRLTNA